MVTEYSLASPTAPAATTDHTRGALIAAGTVDDASCGATASGFTVTNRCSDARCLAGVVRTAATKSAAKSPAAARWLSTRPVIAATSAASGCCGSANTFTAAAHPNTAASTTAAV